MPELHLTGPELPWGSGSALHAAGPELPWGYGITLHATPSAYTPGPPPGGGSPTGTVPVTPGAIIAARASYDVTHTMSVLDLRDGAALDVTSLSLGIDADSALWTLRASGSGSLYCKMMAGDQPAQIEVTLDGLQWVFAVDTVSRSRQAGQSNCDITGRSLAVAAGAPYAGDQNWVNDGPTTGAQLAAIANLYSGLDVSWEVEDWLIPDRVFSFSGTPLAVVLRVAEAIGAVVQADRSACKVRVMPRYLLLPNEWGTVAPDVEVAFEAVLSERFERADQPEYTGVYVSGQQQGAVGFVRLEGTSGAFLHPLVTDLLLTDEPALRQRGQAILGASGGQARVTLELPVLTGAGEPGVLSVGQLLRVLDPAAAWVGLVRAVQVQATLPTVRQTVEVERHTKLLQVSDLHFNGPIPAQTGKVGDAFTALDLTGYWAGGTKPYQFSVASGALPAGLALDPVAGAVSGTPTAEGSTTVRFRAVDRLLGSVDSGDVSFGVTACFVEDFVDGVAPYAQVAGAAAPYTINGGALWIVGTVSGNNASNIRRATPPKTVAKVRITFRLLSSYSDDAPIVTLGSAGVYAIRFNPRREASFDAARRPFVFVGSSEYPVADAALVVGVDYTLTVNIVPGAGNSTSQIVGNNQTINKTLAGDHSLPLVDQLGFFVDWAAFGVLSETAFTRVEICE